MITSEKEREQRQWWAIDGYTVRRVTGFSCAPNNPDNWWCPQIGYTLSEEHHLFKSEMEAVESCINEVQSEIEDRKVSLSRLKARFEKLNKP